MVIRPHRVTLDDQRRHARQRDNPPLLWALAALASPKPTQAVDRVAATEDPCKDEPLAAAGGGAGNPEPLPEPAGFRAIRHPRSQRPERGAGPGATATALGFSLPLLLPPGGCGRPLRSHSRLDNRPEHQ